MGASALQTPLSSLPKVVQINASKTDQVGASSAVKALVVGFPALVLWSFFYEDLKIYGVSSMCTAVGRHFSEAVNVDTGLSQQGTWSKTKS